MWTATGETVRLSHSLLLTHCTSAHCTSFWITPEKFNRITPRRQTDHLRLGWVKVFRQKFQDYTRNDCHINSRSTHINSKMTIDWLHVYCYCTIHGSCQQGLLSLFRAGLHKLSTVKTGRGVSFLRVSHSSSYSCYTHSSVKDTLFLYKLVWTTTGDTVESSPSISLTHYFCTLHLISNNPGQKHLTILIRWLIHKEMRSTACQYHFPLTEIRSTISFIFVNQH